MYRLSIPLMLEQLENYGTEQFADVLKKSGADMVFLAIGCYQTDKKRQEKTFSLLKKHVSLLQQQGFFVGVWFWTFQVEGENSFTHITAPDGKISAAQVCPSDKAFIEFALDYIESIAKCGPDMILFDDDFRYGFIDCGLGCTCQNHRRKIEELSGKKLPEGELTSLLFSGGPNPYRAAYLEANGYYFRQFAKEVRRRVDAINPKMRVGLCACMTTWDFDGVSASELSQILAGNTKPFLRLIGAPYWASTKAWGNRLADVIELERMESAWCDPEIELFAEGDTYPRPRFTCSASSLEGFDMALRASGAVSGIHKYTLDYFADTSYEELYTKKHIQNQPLYRTIDTYFGDKTPVGVRVYEVMQKFGSAEIPSCFRGLSKVEEMFFSPAARLLAAQTIPSTYEGVGTVGIAFGENVRYLPEGALDRGLVLDVTAARILQNSGVDVGLSTVGESYIAGQEYCTVTGQKVTLCGCPVIELTADPKAKILSYFCHRDRKTVGTYAYTNDKGQHFLVFGFEGYSANEHALHQYIRGEQISLWLTSIGKRLPASMPRNPDCYLLCKEGENGKAVWIGNFFADECVNTTVELDGVYDTLVCINCEGVLEGDKVKLKEIPAFASVGFAVSKKKKPG